MDLQANDRSGARINPTSTVSHGQTKRRATIACRHCSMRKVRCDVVTSGLPCGNCTRDDILCEVIPRRKRRGRQRTAASQARLNPSIQESFRPVHDSQYGALVAQNVNCSLHDVPENPTAASRYSTPNEISISEDTVPNTESLSDEGENKDAYVQVLDASPRSPEEKLSSLFYCGGGQGLNGFMFDFNDGGDVRRDTHYLLPHPTSSEMSPQQEAFLKSTSAYQLPAEDICSSLLRCYFRNVHQLLPIIDAQTLLQRYHQNGCGSISLLLLWSIFFASSNFVESGLLQSAGFQTRKAMKRKFYSHAKALYDCDHEKDKITLIQSVILMGLWYSDAEDRSGAWHWIGIAISLSQSIGLHRRLRLANSCSPLSKRRESIYRRIWWSCFVRDRWLSLAKGRPMRINITDCDVEEPSANDVAEELEAMRPETRSEYIPYDPSALAHLWLRLIKISSALGLVLQTHYKVSGPRPEVADVQKCEQEIAACYQSFDTIERSDRMMRLFILQLQLFYEATVIVLYRPYIAKGPAHAEVAVEESWKIRSLDKTRSAAANTSRILESLIEMDLVKDMKSMAITSLIPAMQIHLLDCRSSNALVRRFAGQKLELCMMVMSQLRLTYWGADFMFRLFQRAQAKVAEEFEIPRQSRHRPGLAIGQEATPSRGTQALEPPLEFLRTPPSRQSPSASAPNLSGAAENMSNLNGMHFEGNTYSHHDENDASIEWLLSRGDFTGLFLNMF